MAHLIAGFASRHSNRLLAAIRRKGEPEGSTPPKVQRTNDVADPQEVSVTVNSSGPVQVHVQVSADRPGSTGTSPTLIDVNVIPINDQPSQSDDDETDSGNSDDDCEDRDLNLHVVRDVDLEGVDVTDCELEEGNVEFIHRNSELEPVRYRFAFMGIGKQVYTQWHGLLKTLRKSHGPMYPMCAKTLLRTPRDPTISTPMTPGNYFHSGIILGMLSYRQFILYTGL